MMHSQCISTGDQETLARIRAVAGPPAARNRPKHINGHCQGPHGSSARWYRVTNGFWVSCNFTGIVVCIFITFIRYTVIWRVFVKIALYWLIGKSSVGCQKDSWKKLGDVFRMIWLLLTGVHPTSLHPRFGFVDAGWKHAWKNLNEKIDPKTVSDEAKLLQTAFDDWLRQLQRYENLQNCD